MKEEQPPEERSDASATGEHLPLAEGNGENSPCPRQEMNEMLERLSDGFYAVDTSWRITYMNRQFERLMGISKEECLGRTLWDCMPFLLQTLSYDAYHRALRENITISFERYDTTIQRWLQSTAHPSPSGLSIFLRDITEQKKSADALRLANERFRLAAKTDAIYDWNIETNELIWGEALLDIFGYRPETFQIAEWLEAMHPDDRKEYLPALNRVLHDTTITEWEREYRILHNNGPYCHALDRTNIIRDKNGNAVRLVGVMKNITGQKILEHELQRQRQKTTAAIIQAQERERAEIGRELHDNVNQILTSVKLYQELILANHQEREMLVRKSIGLLLQAINENRSLSKRLSAPTLGNMRLQESVNELAETIAATQRFELTLDTGSIDTLEVSEDLHLAIYRILQEQFTNILKYAGASLVSVRLWVTDKLLRLAISDNGRGFDPDQKRNGIGITNMNMRAESLGGSLVIDSAPGKGCRLEASFPLEG